LRYPRRGGRIVLRSSCWLIICNTHTSQDLIGTLTKPIEATPQDFLSDNILFTAYIGDYMQNYRELIITKFMKMSGDTVLLKSELLQNQPIYNLIKYITKQGRDYGLTLL
jgi:hypothetical protein